MNFLEWTGLLLILILVIWILIGTWRYIVLRTRKDIRMTWGAALQCILFWPFSFWQM